MRGLVHHIAVEVEHHGESLEVIINTKTNSYAGLFMLFPVSAMVSGSRVW